MPLPSSPTAAHQTAGTTRPSRGRSARGRGLVVVGVLALAGCGVNGGADDTTAAAGPTTTADAATTTKPKATTPDAGPTTTQLEEAPDPEPEVPVEPQPPAATVPDGRVTVSDPVNQAFTIQGPDGWSTVAYSSVEGQIVRQVVNSVSPDGGTVVFVGDPKMPSYWNPDTADSVTVQFAEMLDSMELARYTPAEQYANDWVSKKFGELPSFSIDSVERRSDYENSISSGAAQKGMSLQDVQVAELRFSFDDEDGGRTNAAVIAATLDGGGVWQAELFGAATDTGDVTPFLNLASEISASRATDPAFAQTLERRHQETMELIRQRTEEMTRRHEANMAWIQDSANAHQQRMQAIWSANDASMASYYDRMASGDVQQRGFLNYINDERTVVDSSGTKHQVDNSYSRYWMDPSSGQYYGGDANFGESQLRELGIDPSSVEEVQIVKG